MKSQMYVGYKLNALQLISTPEFAKIADRTVVLCNDLADVKTMLDELVSSAACPRMLSTIPMPELRIMRHYTFEDWNQVYSDIAHNPRTTSLSRVKMAVSGSPADQTIMQLSGDAIHDPLSAQFDKYQDAQDVYRTMRRIAFDRGELMAEYNQAMRRYPNAMGVTAWYQAVAAADPGKDSTLYEGHYVEHYLQSLKECKEQMPHYTPGFMLVDNAMIQAADQLSKSLDNKTATLFKAVREVAEEKLTADYRQWCTSLQPDTYLSRVLDKLPEDAHDYVTALFNSHMMANRAAEPEKSNVAHAAGAMYDTIQQCLQQLREDSDNLAISFHGRVPTSLDLHCFEMTSPETAVTKKEMSVVSWYGGDSPEYERENIPAEK